MDSGGKHLCPGVIAVICIFGFPASECDFGFVTVCINVNFLSHQVCTLGFIVEHEVRNPRHTQPGAGAVTDKEESSPK